MADSSEDPLSPPNTYIFDGARARQGYRLNRLAMSLVAPENRAALQADEEAYMARMDLSEAEKALLRRRDWKAMLAGGGNIYLLYKLAGALGVNLMQLGAQMRGESPEAFARRIENQPAPAAGGR